MKKEECLARIDEIKALALKKLDLLGKQEDVESFRVEFFGKKGSISEFSKAMGAMSPEDRPLVGSLLNELRVQLTSSVDEKFEHFKKIALEQQLRSDGIDVTLAGRSALRRFEHPVQMVQDQLVNILESCGFQVEMGPEVEHEFYNFDALNIPPNHPSRTTQDSFYIRDREKKVLLRTHTSPVQVRRMLAGSPPIRMCCPGRVYRADYDATHSPMFHQIEGLLVDKDVTMQDLKGMLSHLVESFFGASLKVRLRPSFFPFTEPSAEIDMECCFCKGQGCRTCKGSGWIEIGGSGMVDPEVFKSVGLDPETWRGFAFGMGLERMTMLKYNIQDLRVFFESDDRFLSQFSRFLP